MHIDILTFQAIDESGFEINTTLQIEIVDVDDLPPSFQYPGCQNNCSVTPYEAYTGPSWRVCFFGIKNHYQCP